MVKQIMITKKGLLSAGLLAALISVPTLTLAVEGQLTTLESERAARQATRADRVKNYVDRVIERLNRVITKLDDISARVDIYLTQLESRGANTADARVKQKAAQDAILAAKGAITALPSQIGASVNPEKLTPAEAKKIRAAVKIVADSVKNANKATQDLIKAVRAARVSINPAGTEQFKTNPPPAVNN